MTVSYTHLDVYKRQLLVLSVIPIIVFYLTCQKYIIEGVVAGAVKG